jgi:FAD-dependent oxidoreductase domain-containing protein 1
MQTVDIAIVGGAAVGSAAAYFLAANPDFTGSVLVLEQDFSYEHCATARSAASIRHQFSTPDNIRMSQFGTQFVRNVGTLLVADGDVPDVGFHEGGYLFLATRAGLDVLQANHRVQRNLDVDVALLTPAQLQARFPWMQTDDLSAGSLGLSGEGWLDAYGLMRALRRKAVSLGVQYREAKVIGVQRLGRRITQLALSDGSTVSCGSVINAAGTGAAELARAAGLALCSTSPRPHSWAIARW